MMGVLKSYVPELLVKKGWDVKTFVARCMLAGLSQDTAYRLARGDTNFTAETMRVIANLLELGSISEVIDIADEQ